MAAVNGTVPVGALPVTVAMKLRLDPAGDGFELLESVVALAVTPELACMVVELLLLPPGPLTVRLAL